MIPETNNFRPAMSLDSNQGGSHERGVACHNCGKTDTVITSKSLRPKTLAMADQMKVRLPSCPRCFNAQIAGISMSRDISPTSALSVEVNSLQNYVHSRLRNGALKYAKEIRDRIKQTSEKYDSIWRYIQNDLDRLKDVPTKVVKLSISFIRRDILKMNSLHTKICEVVKIASSVIQTDYEQSRAEANATLRNRFLRDSLFSASRFACKICGDPDDLTIDHIIPVVLGGNSRTENLQVLCRKCNSSKGKRILPMDR